MLFNSNHCLGESGTGGEEASLFAMDLFKMFGPSLVECFIDTLYLHIS
jgi:hypothetical protein